MTGGGRIVHARRWLGVVAREWPAYRDALARPDRSYLTLHNRGEALEAAPDGSGYRCAWQWTSDLHAPKFLPSLGRDLLRRSLADHPIATVDAPAARDAQPEITFVIGHRGEARLAHLLSTLRSIAGQRDARVECVVVEQDTIARAKSHLPSWVRHVHAPPPREDMPYCRAWAFNIGVREAKAPLVVLHDNDMLVPGDYASTALRIAQSGYEAMNLKRFVFYLAQDATTQLLSGASAWSDAPPEAIVQNLEAGGSVVIAREAYERIGGMDESFIGWGGEDNEFWERCRALRVWPWGSLPIVHCWHAPQPGKENAARDTTALWRAKSAIAIEDRIARLRGTASGAASGPQGVA